MFTLPQEMEVRYVIPAIRKEFANCLTKNHGYTYEGAGQLLGITKAAISQYLKNKRAANIKLHVMVIKEVRKSCNLIAKNKSNATREIMKILAFIRDKDLPSEVCYDQRGRVLEECEEIRINYNMDNRID